MADALETRSIPQLLSDLTSDLSNLVQKEVALLRGELGEKVGRLGRAAGEAAGGAVLLLASVLLVLQAIVFALADALGFGWASLIVGVAAAAIGYLLIRAGMSAAKPEKLKPERSLNQLRETAQIAKDATP